MEGIDDHRIPLVERLTNEIGHVSSLQFPRAKVQFLGTYI